MKKRKLNLSGFKTPTPRVRVRKKEDSSPAAEPIGEPVRNDDSGSLPELPEARTGRLVDWLSRPRPRGNGSLGRPDPYTRSSSEEVIPHAPCIATATNSGWAERVSRSILAKILAPPTKVFIVEAWVHENDNIGEAQSTFNYVPLHCPDYQFPDEYQPVILGFAGNAYQAAAMGLMWLNNVVGVPKDSLPRITALGNQWFRVGGRGKEGIGVGEFYKPNSATFNSAIRIVRLPSAHYLTNWCRFNHSLTYESPVSPFYCATGSNKAKDTPVSRSYVARAIDFFKTL